MKQAFGLLQSISTRGVMLAALAWPLAAAGTFGTVVPIGGQTGDIALDEGRGVLYIANFTAGRIEVMSLSDLSIPRSINVNPFPNSIALSPDGRFLVVTHYGNFAKPIDPNNALTVINLSDSSRQTFGLGSAPLAVAFGNDGKALLVTTTEISQFDPVSGGLSVIDTIPSLAAKTLPQDGPAFPLQITESVIGVSGDGRKIYGTTEAFGFSFDVQQKELKTFPTKGAVPPFGPRSVAVNRDGSYFALGWAVLDSRGRWLWESYNTASQANQANTGQFHVGGYAIDSVAGLVYAQVPESLQPAPTGGQLRVLEADNGTVRETFKLTENLAGHAILNNARDTIYAASDSGVIVLPVGSLGSQRRVVAAKEDLVFRGNLCDKKISTQEMQIVDPAGGRTDFVLTSNIPGISISPSSGVTPALVRVSVDPNGFQNQKGTLSGTITISSLNAVNVPQPVRVLINNREPDQRGTFVNIPGKIVDILADPGRDRFYVVRQDKNQILVYDGTTFNVLATLRTNNTPTQLAITRDAKWLLVGHSHSWNANVYDLDTFETQRPIEFPYAHYPLSIAVSGRAILALADNRQVGRGYNTIDSVDFLGRRATELPTLGAITNKFTSFMTLSATPNAAAIFGAANDGTVLLYDANADAFTTIRKDLGPQVGAYAASNNGQYVVGNNLLNSSLVPVKKFETLTGSSSGFAFVEQNAYRTTTSSNGGAGVIQRVDLTEATSIRPTRIVEAPLLVPQAQPGGTASTRYNDPTGFMRTLAPLLSRQSIISLTQSGFTVLPWNYDAAVPIPRLNRIVNAADQTRPVAPGGLISVFGSELSPVNIASREIPLPTALGESCLSVNGVGVPLLMVSSSQVNGQLPFNIDGNAQIVLRTPGGISDNLNFNIQPNAPSIFRANSTPSVVRIADSSLIGEDNPVRKGDELVIFATGLGRTSPTIDAGLPAPSDPLAVAATEPEVRLGRSRLQVSYAGLTPGEVGVYQINVRVPEDVDEGDSVPLVIEQGSGSTTLQVRVRQ